MSNLAAIVDLVEAELKDSTNAVWTAAEIQAHVRRALQAYNRVLPQTALLEVHTAADTLEYSLAAITGLMDILSVWFPYEAADPVYPAAYIPWTRFDIAGVNYIRLEIDVELEGDDADNFRLLYTLPHTVEDLDSATATTLDSRGEYIIVLGATAYAATQIAQSLIGTVTATRMTPDDYQKWANDRQIAFNLALHDLRRRADIGHDARTRPAQDTLL